MVVSDASAPSLEELRPLKPASTPTFPVYRDLASRLARTAGHPDDTVAHVMATCAGYAYAKAETVTMILARMGLEDNRCRMIMQLVDAMFICSTSFLVQSADGSVLILIYRGTEPANGINWLTDVDLHPDKIAIPVDGGDATYGVHEGFYRNVRATRYEVVAALRDALEGKPVTGGGSGQGLRPVEALYITGHSLGGAMAALMAVMLVTDPAYAAIAEKLRAVYTFGQPMIGGRALARACDAHAFLGRSVLRYVYRHDVVPHVPPKESGDFAHFGPEYVFEGDWPWRRQTQPAEQASLLGILESPLAFFARQLDRLRRVSFTYSLDDHRPQHYVSRLTPPGTPTEFGDFHLAD